MLMSGIRRHRQFRWVEFGSVQLGSHPWGSVMQGEPLKPSQRSEQLVQKFFTLASRKRRVKSLVDAVDGVRVFSFHLGDLFKDLRCRICLQVITRPMDVPRTTKARQTLEIVAFSPENW